MHFLGKCTAIQAILGSPVLGMAELANAKISDILKSEVREDNRKI